MNIYKSRSGIYQGENVKLKNIKELNQEITKKLLEKYKPKSLRSIDNDKKVKDQKRVA